MASTINLSFEAPDYGNIGQSKPDRDTKTCYPSLNIPGNMALAKSLKVGKEFTATVKFRVCEISIRERDGDDDDMPGPYGGTHVELEAQSMTIDGVKISEPDGEESGSDAISKYFAKDS